MSGGMVISMNAGLSRLLLFSILSLPAGQALAELGGNTSSIAADGVKMQAAARILPSQNYTVHENEVSHR